MSNEKKIPKVRMAKPTGRPIQLRYTDPDTKKEIRITTETHDPIIAAAELAKLEAKLLLGLDAKPKRRRGGPTMGWQEFRDRYTELKLAECCVMRALKRHGGFMHPATFKHRPKRSGSD